jgi:hypothetical protein
MSLSLYLRESLSQTTTTGWPLWCRAAKPLRAATPTALQRCVQQRCFYLRGSGVQKPLLLRCPAARDSPAAIIPPHIRYVTSFPSVLLLTPLAEYRHQHCEVPQQICEILHRLAVILLSIRFDDIFEPQRHGANWFFSNDNYGGLFFAVASRVVSHHAFEFLTVYPFRANPPPKLCRGHWRPR